MFSVTLRNGPVASERTVRASIDICNVATAPWVESRGFLPMVEEPSDNESDPSTREDAEMNDVGRDNQKDKIRVEASKLVCDTESPVY